jgi:hypothetical protein
VINACARALARINFPGDPVIGAKLRKSLVDPIDERLRHNALVLGGWRTVQRRPFRRKGGERAARVLHATVGDEDIVVFHRPGTLHTLAYSAVLDGERREFELGD